MPKTNDPADHWISSFQKIVFLLKQFLFLFLIGLNATGIYAQRLPDLIPYLQKGKWGYADSNGNVRIQAQWDNVELFKDGRAEVIFTPESGNWIYCTIDTKGNYIIPPSRHWNGTLYPSLKNASYNAIGQDGKWGIIDADNRELIPCLYDKTDGRNDESQWSGSFHDDTVRHWVYCVAKKDGYFGIIDTNNKTIFPFEYDGFFRIYTGPHQDVPPQFLTFVKNGKKGLVDTGHNLIFPPIYDHIMFDNRHKDSMQLWKDNQRIIAGTDGKILIDIPGYWAGYPVDGLIPVTKMAGGSGLMDYKHNIVIPCLYTAAWSEHDTIKLLKDSMLTPGGNTVWYHRYYNRITRKPLTAWFADPPFPPAVYREETYRNKPLPVLVHMGLSGYERDTFSRDDKFWVSTPARVHEDGTPLSTYGYNKGAIIRYNILKGMSLKQDSTLYIAITDSTGQYILPPQASQSTILAANFRDSLLLVHNKKDSTDAVTDFALHQLIPYQSRPLVRMFRYKGEVYAIIEGPDDPYPYKWIDHAMNQFAYYNPPYHKLIGRDGKVIPALETFDLQYLSDAYGLKTGNHFDYGKNDFNAPFEGYFVIKDIGGKMAIVDIQGKPADTAVSFKYASLKSLGKGMFIVSNETSQDSELMNRMAAMTEPGKHAVINPKGQPYIVNSRNQVMLDSLTVESGYNLDNDTPGGPKAGLYKITVKENGYIYDNRYFYMDIKGRGYFSKHDLIRSLH